GRLATLVASTDRVTAAIETSRPGLDTLLDGAAATFAAVAQEADGLQRTLEQAPATLDQARGTLGRADGTLRAVDTLAGRLAPGVVELRRVAAPLRGTLERLVEVGPDARSTVSTLGSAAPALDTLLDTAGGLMPRLRVIGRQGAAALSCIRPYAPDIAGLFTTWGSGIWANADSQDHYVRAEVGTYAFPNASPLNSEQLSKLEPGLSVNFPRAPGAIVDQPWYQPQCGIDATATNAAADPENRATAAYPPAFFTDHSNPDPAAGR
ncbi:MAG: phospholipid/cholesterol/gamma-HCH transport system substrate-binding protein, partial [Solirubrobacteraceae bacterium]|nr:phospholipid/cholesterol/gamma-HCH transport system substrate-binding protein [Solirubrobacteraceae bacterium]